MYTCAAKSTLILEKDDKLTCSKDSFGTSVSPGELAVVVNFPFVQLNNVVKGDVLPLTLYKFNNTCTHIIVSTFVDHCLATEVLKVPDIGEVWVITDHRYDRPIIG